jgi:hypothetical protein
MRISAAEGRGPMTNQPENEDDRSAGFKATLDRVNADAKDLAHLMQGVIEAKSREEMLALYRAYDAKVRALQESLFAGSPRLQAWAKQAEAWRTRSKNGPF